MLPFVTRSISELTWLSASTNDSCRIIHSKITTRPRGSQMLPTHLNESVRKAADQETDRGGLLLGSLCLIERDRSRHYV